MHHREKEGTTPPARAVNESGSVLLFGDIPNGIKYIASLVVYSPKGYCSHIEW